MTRTQEFALWGLICLIALGGVVSSVASQEDHCGARVVEVVR